MSCLVLLSGGLDSAVTFYDLLHKAKKEQILTTSSPSGDRRRQVFGPVHAAAFYYGQRHESELAAAEKVFKTAQDQGLPTGRFFTPPTLETFSGDFSSLTGPTQVAVYENPPTEREAMRDPAFVPYRNLLFFVAGAMLARSLDARIIGTGIRGGYPDCTEAFERRVEATLEAAVPGTVVLLYSAAHGSRAETVVRARGLSGCWEALAHTVTCFQGVPYGCGNCLPCHRRAQGFAEAGFRDPAYIVSHCTRPE